MGLIRATAGRATILGCDVGETAFRRHVGFLPENPYFYDYLTGREILHFYAKLSGVPGRRRAERVEELLEWVGLADARTRACAPIRRACCSGSESPRRSYTIRRSSSSTSP